MPDPFLGEIRMFAGTFAPSGWAFCDGQLLSISQASALFALLGTTYGGNGQVTFGLPDLRGRIPVHAGTGSDLSPRTLGEGAGEEQVTLTNAQLPTHNHRWQATGSTGNSATPTSRLLATAPSDIYIDRDDAETPVDMNAAALTEVGNNQPHTNLQPFRCIHFIIALFGIFPSQS